MPNRSPGLVLRESNQGKTALQSKKKRHDRAKRKRSPVLLMREMRSHGVVRVRPVPQTHGCINQGSIEYSYP